MVLDYTGAKNKQDLIKKKYFSVVSLEFHTEFVSFTNDLKDYSVIKPESM